MTATILATNPLTTVSLMLTLAGLVGSFFNIQLTQWLRDLAALHQKTSMNRANNTETQQKAIVECVIEIKRLTNIETYIVNGLVILFVAFVLGDGLCMIQSAASDPIYPNILVALWVFLVFFVLVSGGLWLRGLSTVKSIREMLPPKPTK